MSLYVQSILSFLFAISVASNVQDESIAKMAIDVLSSEHQQQFAVTNDIKEWTIDWHSDFEEVRSSLMVPGSQVDAKQLLEDILCDNGHDEESDMGDEWTRVDPMGRCGCCGAMKSLTSTYPSPMMMSMYSPMRYPSFANNLQPQLQTYNGLVQTVCDRMVVDFKMSGLDPMPMLLRRRSVREKAILTLSRFHAARSMRSNSSDQGERNGRDHEGLESSQWEVAPVHVFCSLTGLSTLRRTGDVQAMALSNGRKMLKVNLVAGPLKLELPSGATATGMAPPAENPSNESDLSQDHTSDQTITVEEVNAEMHLMLHPRAGILLHSFQFSKPTKFSNEAGSVPLQRIPLHATAIPIIDSLNEAAVAQQLRRSIRRTLRNS
ncbi:uncharacterized protein LOC130703938 [Daphnia carinata]|uniref:uncharacterized protein LOC130703938 n=1 Tax=Daphnia carinata TaxID=120202 RepID=UPI00257F5BDF|nr:uncharacterized protein LOC130703938 [Daphnia carinata]